MKSVVPCLTLLVAFHFAIPALAQTDGRPAAPPGSVMTEKAGVLPATPILPPDTFAVPGLAGAAPARLVSALPVVPEVDVPPGMFAVADGAKAGTAVTDGPAALIDAAPPPLVLPAPVPPHGVAGHAAATPPAVLPAKGPAAPTGAGGGTDVTVTSAANAQPAPAVADGPLTWAAAPGPDLRPRRRAVEPPAAAATAAAASAPVAAPSLRPRLRAEAAQPKAVAPAAQAASMPLLRPRFRPAGLARSAAPQPAGAGDREAVVADAATRTGSRADTAADAPVATAEVNGKQVVFVVANPAPSTRRPGRRQPSAEVEATSLSAPAAEDEPEEVTRAAARRTRPGDQLVRPRRGALCGDPDIEGEKLAPITSRVKGCGIAEPVRVTAVDGVRLSVPATLDCAAATALKTWVETGLKPAVGRKGVNSIGIAASYTCRPRNNVRGARISEHGRGRAVDVMSVTLGTGEVLEVLRDYRRDAGKVLRASHKAACGIFGTTLGPGSDGYHENHLHFDVASYRNGTYCR